MKADQKVYDYMYARIPEVIRGREVLELATGPGLLAKHVAPAAKRMIATDYSDGMIAEAKKGDNPANLTFEIADAMALPSRIWSQILNLAGVRFAHQWTGQEYLDFLKKQGWRVILSREMAARITLMYAECVRKEE